MGACEACKHWSPLEYPGEYPSEDGVWGECMYAPGPQASSYPSIATSVRMYVHDASGYAAGLTTRSDFGCIEWEEATDE